MAEVKRIDPMIGYTKLMIDCDLVAWENELTRIKAEYRKDPEHYDPRYYEGVVHGIKLALRNFEGVI